MASDRGISTENEIVREGVVAGSLPGERAPRESHGARAQRSATSDGDGAICEGDATGEGVRRSREGECAITGLDEAAIATDISREGRSLVGTRVGERGVVELCGSGEGEVAIHRGDGAVRGENEVVLDGLVVEGGIDDVRAEGEESILLVAVESDGAVGQCEWLGAVAEGNGGDIAGSADIDGGGVTSRGAEELDVGIIGRDQVGQGAVVRTPVRRVAPRRAVATSPKRGRNALAKVGVDREDHKPLAVLSHFEREEIVADAVAEGRAVAGGERGGEVVGRPNEGGCVIVIEGIFFCCDGGIRLGPAVEERAVAGTGEALSPVHRIQSVANGNPLLIRPLATCPPDAAWQVADANGGVGMCAVDGGGVADRQIRCDVAADSAEGEPGKEVADHAAEDIVDDASVVLGESAGNLVGRIAAVDAGVRDQIRIVDRDGVVGPDAVLALRVYSGDGIIDASIITGAGVGIRRERDRAIRRNGAVECGSVVVDLFLGGA